MPFRVREENPQKAFNEFDSLALSGANCQNVVETMMKSDPYYQRLA
jgi:hypothetical protein